MALCLLLLAGCDGGGGVRLPVSGKVTYQGRPLLFGTIDFQSRNAVGGGPIRSGNYHLPAEHGLPAGVYRVSISSVESVPRKPEPPGPDGKDDGKELIPPQFNIRCEKTIEVKQGAENQFNFDIP